MEQDANGRICQLIDSQRITVINLSSTTDELGLTPILLSDEVLIEFKYVVCTLGTYGIGSHTVTVLCQFVIKGGGCRA